MTDSVINAIRRSRVGRRLESRLRFGDSLLVSVGDTNGVFWKPGWWTVDLVDADFLCDVREQRLPFADGSVDVLNCSHLVEHLPHPAASHHFFGEVHRVLKERGVFRVATPDAALLLEKYRAGDWRFFLQCDGRFILECIVQGKIPPESLLLHNRLVGWFASYSSRYDTAGGPLVVDPARVDRQARAMGPFEFSRWCVSLLEPGRAHAHVNLYDEERLCRELREAGFTEVRTCAFGVSASEYISRFHIDREQHRLYSLYVEAMKDRVS